MKFTALFVASATVIDRLNNRSISRTKQLSNFTIYANDFNLKIRVWAFSDFGRKNKAFRQHGSGFSSLHSKHERSS